MRVKNHMFMLSVPVSTMTWLCSFLAETHGTCPWMKMGYFQPGFHYLQPRFENPHSAFQHLRGLKLGSNGLRPLEHTIADTPPKPHMKEPQTAGATVGPRPTSTKKKTVHATYSRKKSAHDLRFLSYTTYTNHPNQSCTRPTPKNTNECHQPFCVLRGLCSHFESSPLWGHRENTGFVATGISPPFGGVPETTGVL